MVCYDSIMQYCARYGWPTKIQCCIFCIITLYMDTSLTIKSFKSLHARRLYLRNSWNGKALGLCNYYSAVSTTCLHLETKLSCLPALSSSIDAEIISINLPPQITQDLPWYMIWNFFRTTRGCQRVSDNHLLRPFGL